jgi:hypothetical protein
VLLPQEAMKLAYLRWQQLSDEEADKRCGFAGIKAPSGIEPLYEALQASA